MAGAHGIGDGPARPRKSDGDASYEVSACWFSTRGDRRLETKASAAEYLAATGPIDTPRGRLLFYANTQRAYHYPWFFHRDDPATLEWIDGFGAGACFWNAGANIGVFTKNIEINAMDDRISAYCMAFCERMRLNVLNMEHTEGGHSMHGFGADLNAYDTIINTRFRQAAIGYPTWTISSRRSIHRR